MTIKSESAKFPGKTAYSGRRRPMTRKSGFSSCSEATGGELKIVDLKSYPLKKGQSISIEFSFPSHSFGEWIGFGGWFAANNIAIQVENPNIKKHTLENPSIPNWGKVGSMWISDGTPGLVTVNFTAEEDGSLVFWEMACGVIYHKYLENERDALLKNMYQYSPEAHFYSKSGKMNISFSGGNFSLSQGVKLYLKSCNRCARFLPINTENERLHLSFTNHCVAEHRTPCSHSGFGRLTNVETGEILKLYYGYQLECRFCKKFEVNAAHNPKRTAAQMKEDGTRRRALEVLLRELNQKSPQLAFRHETGKELAPTVWENFEKKCFNCGKILNTPNSMNLDHTRPLALMWPLDGAATALCKDCNGAKRDRPPSEFYTYTQIEKLSTITGIPIGELLNPAPNIAAIDLLVDNLDWFFDTFLLQPQMLKIRDGKVPAELLVKALQKAINKYPEGAPVDLLEEYKRRRESS